MYKLVYNWKETKGNEVVEREYDYNEVFRLKKDATHNLQTMQNDFQEIGYTATLTKSSRLYCFKSEMTNDEKLKVTEWDIIVKKI
jgi:hypothetical protein